MTVYIINQYFVCLYYKRIQNLREALLLTEIERGYVMDK